LFDKVHVTRATASCPRDNCSNKDVSEVEKTKSDDVKLATLKKAKNSGNKINPSAAVLLLKRRKRRIHSFDYTRTHD
jgi:hypothetical protein